MEVKELSTFSTLSEPDRLIFIAQINHAIWYDEEIYSAIKRLLKFANNKLPEAKYFPPTNEEQ